MYCGSGMPGAHSPRRSSETVRASRTRRAGSARARLRTRPNGAANSPGAAGLQPEDRAVEQGRLVEVVEGLGEPHVVHGGDAQALARTPRGAEVAAPVGVDPGPAEEQRGAVGGGDGGEVGLGGTVRAGEAGRPEPGRAPGRGRWVRRLDRERTDRRGGALGAVDEDAGAALLPAVDGLGEVLPGAGEAQGGERVVEGRVLAAGGDLDERRALDGRRRPAHRVGPGAAGGRGLREREQRAVPVHGGAHGVGLAEDVVEDLERERPGVAGVQDRGEEARQVEAALAGEEPVVAAPLQHVHREHRGVGELEEEDLLAGDLGDPVDLGRAGEDVEAVEAEAQRRVVGPPDDVPGRLPRVDVPAPRERLVGEPQAALGGPVGQAVQLAGEPVGVARRRRGRPRSTRARCRCPGRA